MSTIWSVPRALSKQENYNIKKLQCTMDVGNSELTAGGRDVLFRSSVIKLFVIVLIRLALGTRGGGCS